MRPNLSLDKITAALAVIGATALVGCGGGDQKPAVNANEVAPAGDKKADGAGAGHCGADAKHEQGQASCGASKGAGSCGASGQGSCGGAAKGSGDAAKPDTSAASGSGSSTTPTSTDTKAAADTTKSAPATPAPTTTAKKPAPPAKKGGASGCGAGTCAAKK